jgi:hypothetical protein
LAAQQPQAAAVVPLRYWPRGVAVYQRAREIPDGVVQDWSVQGVVLRVVWPTVEAFASGGVAAAAAKLVPRVPRVIKVHHDFGFRGPSLSVHDESGRAIKADEPVWPELALVLGGRAPYWPYGLRDAAAMRRWRPGDPSVPVAAAVDALDPAPLLRLAALIPAGDTAHAVLVELARYAEHRASEDAAHTVEMITGDPNMAAWVDLAATSMQVPEPDDLDEVVLRDGWLAVAARIGTLAHQAVSEVRKSRYSVFLPYTAAEYIDPTTGLGAEWAARLRPTSPYAGFEVLYDHLGADEEHTIIGYLTDPATDAPVVRLASGKLLAAVPHRLLASSHSRRSLSGHRSGFASPTAPCTWLRGGMHPGSAGAIRAAAPAPSRCSSRGCSTTSPHPPPTSFTAAAPDWRTCCRPPGLMAPPSPAPTSTPPAPGSSRGASA